MRRSLLPFAALGGLLLGGCDVPQGRAGSRQVAELTPKLDARSTLRLTRFGNELAVGDPAERATEIFPPLRGAYAFSDLPSILSNGFESRGWETTDEGFGAIFAEGRVAAAMRQFMSVDKPRADDLLANLERTNGRAKPTLVTGPNVEYRFWEEGTAILMYCRRAVKSGKYDVTEALGDSQVMGALQMNAAKARTSVEQLSKPPEGAASNAPVNEGKKG